MLALFLRLDVLVYYVGEAGLAKLELNFGVGSKPRKVRLYLGPDGGFDTLYDKSFVKSAGICQSMLLDVSLRHLYS